MTKSSAKFKIAIISTSLIAGFAIPTISVAQTRTSVAPAPAPLSNLTSYRGPNQSYVSVSHEFEKGIRQFEKGNLHLAKVAFRNVTSARQKEYYSQSVSYLGLIATKRDDHESAVKYFRHVLRGNPNNYGLKTVLGLSYIELGRSDKARALLADMKRKQYRHYENGSDEKEVKSSIAALGQALNRAATT